MPLRTRNLVLRFGASAFSAAVFLVFILLRSHAPGLYFQALFWLGDVAYRYPFLDLEAVLQAGGCWRAGVDVYLANACMGGGSYNYSPLLLRAAVFPIGAQDRVAGGLLMLFSYAAALALLPPPLRLRALAVRCAAAISPAVIFGLERGNLDLLVFCGLALGVALALRAPLLRLLGYMLIAGMAFLKFYPAAALAVIVKEPWRLLLLYLLVLALLSAAYFCVFSHGTATALKTLPGGPPFGYWFGDTNLAYGIALLAHMPVFNLNPDITQYRAILLHGNTLAVANLCVLVMRLLAFGAAIRLADPACDHPASGTKIFLIAGSALLCGCFFAAQNVVYRELFFLFALPGLAVHPRGGWLVPAVMFLMWEEALRRAFGIFTTWLLGAQTSIDLQIAFWLVREIIWWWVIIELGAILAGFGLAALRRMLGAQAA
jgi:hypothetical protein